MLRVRNQIHVLPDDQKPQGKAQPRGERVSRLRLSKTNLWSKITMSPKTVLGVFPCDLKWVYNGIARMIYLTKGSMVFNLKSVMFKMKIRCSVSEPIPGWFDGFDKNILLWQKARFDSRTGGVWRRVCWWWAPSWKEYSWALGNSLVYITSDVRFITVILAQVKISSSAV